MYYLIHTTHHTRPFLTTHAFIARDFREWGYRVDCHVWSPYIAEIIAREKRTARAKWGVELMEIWAHQVIGRKQEECSRNHQTADVRTPADDGLSQEEKRLEKVSSMVKDFVDGVAAFDECGCEIPKYFLGSTDRPRNSPGDTHRSFPIDPRLMPSDSLGLISKYMHLLNAVRLTLNAPLPAWSNPDIIRVDLITLEFRFHDALKQGHLVHALSSAMGKKLGRMGRIEKVKMTGITKVLLFVDINDCCETQDDEGETIDPAPIYERGENPPPYVEGS